MNQQEIIEVIYKKNQHLITQIKNPSFFKCADSSGNNWFWHNTIDDFVAIKFSNLKRPIIENAIKNTLAKSL